MASYKDLNDYFDSRGVDATLRDKYGIVYIGGTEAASRLGFRSLPDTSVCAWMPGSGEYGHCLVISSNGFSDVTRQRYCPSGLHDAILLGGTDWGVAPERVVFTESYVKGVVAREVLGLPTIVLNGVAGASDRNHPSRVVKSLRNLPWKGRGVRAIILFDSLNQVREESAANVRRAREQLAAMLRIRYNADTSVAELPAPPLPAEDWGVDDFVAARGAEALRSLIQGAVQLEVDEIGAAIINFNERFAVVKDLARVVELSPPYRRMALSDFKLNYGNEKYTDAQGDRHPIVDPWINSTTRTTLDRVRFLPGQPSVVDNCLNMWSGLQITPDVKGIDEAEEMWAKVVREAVPDGAEWLLDALACLVQRPEARCGFYLYLYGDYGTGKGYTMLPIKRIFGEHNAHCSQMRAMDYCGRFNALKNIARLIVVDEVQEDMTNEDAAKMEAELKLDADPGQGYRPLEFKGRDVVTVDRNCLVTIISNLYTPPWTMQAGDRRAAMFEYSRHMAIYDEGNRPWGSKDNTFWKTRFQWMEAGGAAKVLAWLQARDISRFNPEEPPLLTKYKRDVTASKMGLEGFIQQVKLDPKSALVFAGADLSKHRYWTSELLLYIYHQGEHDYHPDIKAREIFGKKMRSAGYAGIRTTCRWYKVKSVVLFRLWGPEGEGDMGEEFKALVNEITPLMVNVNPRAGQKY